MKRKDRYSTKSIRKAVGLIIMSIIGLIHFFRIGNYLQGAMHALYYSYVSDFIIPFGVYFLLCIAEFDINMLRKWPVKALVIIGFTTLAELFQFIGFYSFGNTFDSLDIAMYIGGVGMAVLVDRCLFKHFIPRWDY